MLPQLAFHLLLALAATQPATRPADQWGEASSGLQISLRADQQVYRAGQTPAFTAAVRYQGKRTDLMVPTSQEMWTIEVDGKRYQLFDSAENIKSIALTPGKRSDDIPITLIGPWSPLDKGNNKRLKLTSGKHTLRVIVTTDTDHPLFPDLQATSNAIEFFIVEEKQAR